jgi:hypothetical protein
MSSNTHLLFPNLPPELRNETYAYLSTPSSASSAVNTGLPLPLKTFTCKHTTVQIIPVHTGTPGLLSLPAANFPEAREYASWLLNNGVSLRIGVHFKGRVNTFVQGDWDKKMEAHLRKLVKAHPWLQKVADVEIQILWDAPDGALKSKNKKRIAGQIPLDMVKTLTLMMDEEVKRKRGHVKMGLHLDHRYAVGNTLSPVKFGLERSLLGEVKGVKTVRKEVRKAPYSYERPRPLLSEFVAIPSVSGEEKALLEVKEGVVTWSEWTRGLVVVKKIDGSLVEVGDLEQERDAGPTFPLEHMIAECLGRA